MLGFSTYAALLPELRDEWRLSNAQAGLIGGLFFAGYIATVSFWTVLTDRVDGRKVYLAGALLSAMGSAGFGLFAGGLFSAIFFQVLFGAGIAATYMPGLRLLSDRVSGPAQSRYVAFYTSFFGIGAALSYAIAGFATPAFGWEWTFIVSGAGPFAAGLLVFALVAPMKAHKAGWVRFSMSTFFPLRAWREVLSDRAAAGYTLGYFVHCLELFGSRAWMVAFLAFSAGFQSSGGFPWPAAAMAAAINLCAVPASILGNEAALRVGRRRWILLMMVGSGAGGMLVALGAPWHWGLVLALLTLYSMLVMADSGTLTAGLVAAAPAHLRGAAMGLYSLLGFAGGMLGPVLFGAALDAAGGASSSSAWLAAYAAIGMGCLAAPVLTRILSR
jgi:MFS family permease